MELKREFLVPFILLFGNCFCVGNFEGENVAFGKTPTQGPGTLEGLEARLAVDGNAADSGACARTTQAEPNSIAWWQIYLEQPYWISRIKIFNTESKLRERHFGMLVRGYTNNNWAGKSILFHDQHKAEGSCLSSYPKRGKDVCADVIEIEINPAKQLDFISITTPNNLTLCEVEVFKVAASHKYCRVPEAPMNGMYLFRNNEIVSGETVPIHSDIVSSCKSRYIISNPSSVRRTCLDSGDFDGTKFECYVTCKIPSVENGVYYTNGKTDLKDMVSYSDYIYLKCDEGYNISPNGFTTDLKCHADGGFGDMQLTCEAIKCNSPPSSFSNGFYKPSDVKGPFSYNFVFTPMCNVGFTLARGHFRTCVSWDRWNGLIPLCTQVTCRVPRLLYGSYLFKNRPVTASKELSFGTIIQPICQRGYFLPIDEHQTCQENGSFSVGDSQCTIVTCSSLGKLENGILHYSDRHNINQYADGSKNYIYGVKVRASCVSGFQLMHGSTEQNCLENGTWDGVKPECSKKRCKDTNILGERFQQSSTVFSFFERGTASYNESSMYLVNGNLSFICLANGSLSWEFQPPELAPVCIVQHKDKLIVNTDGCLRKDICEIGKRVSYDCVGDYKASVRNATCQADHTWSAEPICSAMSQPSFSGSIIGASAAVGVAAIAIVIAVLLFLNRRKLHRSKTETRYETPDELKEELNVYSEISETQTTDRKKVKDSAEYAYASNTNVVVEDKDAASPSDQSYYTFESSKKIPVTAIKVEELYDVVLGSKHGVSMKKQFQDFPKGLKDDYSAALQIQNTPKNRYKHIYPYNDTRVILPMDERHSDYINASFIHGHNKTRAFIASQGPTDDILVDFWRMVWHLDCGKIVMLTNLEEDNKMKCVQYWPDEGCKEYEDFLITNRGTEYFSDFIIRKLSIRKTHGEERKLIHFHFTAWPDKSVPKYSSSLVHFRHKVETTTVKEKGPVIVHCSAGVGRTGTFIALNVLSEQAATVGYVDPVGCVSTLRKQRVDMVQTEEQYVFLHMALLETLMLSTSALPASKFMGAYDKLLASDKTMRTRDIDVEFSRMEKMSPVADECQYVSAKELRNRNKNRYSNILPAADHMPYLTPSGKRSEPDYINAVFLPGYKRKGAFIVTQTPLEATKTDFWRLVVEHDVHTIVMMNNKSEMKYHSRDRVLERKPVLVSILRGREIVPLVGIEPITPRERGGHSYGSCLIVPQNKEDEIYWPENEDSETYENIMITKTGQAREKGLRKITLDLKRFGQTRKLQQIQFESWPDDSALPSSPKDVLSLLDAVQFWQHQSGNNPVLVHCMNGADRSGLFCVASTVLERMKIEQDVAITQVIKEMRNYREQIIPSVDQFQFVHEVVKEYILQNETYSNFTY